MLNRSELDRYGPPGFHLAQKEKDYVQHWVLSFLSRSGFGGVFKGGTCLQKVFGLPRYSEDLDFTLDGADAPDQDSMSAFLSSAGFSGFSWKNESSQASQSAKLRFRGPLYNGSTISEGTILLEFSKRESVLLKPAPFMITAPYPDILPYQLRIMEKDEIAAEKFRAILTRNSARDLFDLYFLLHQEAKLRKTLVGKKLSWYKLEFDHRTFESRVKQLQKIWKREMEALTPNLLEYDTVAKAVLSEAKALS